MNRNTFNQLMKFFKTKEDLKRFINTPLNELYVYHFSFGMWIRNNVLKRKIDSIKIYEEFGVSIDDLSNDIIHNFYMTLKAIDGTNNNMVYYNEQNNYNNEGDFIMRRKDREQSIDFAYEVVSKCEYATLSMVDLNGNPYSIPITIANDDKFLYFHSAKVGTKTDILRQNPRVCVVCVNNVLCIPSNFTTMFESAIVKGTAIEVTDDSQKIDALRLICERYASSNMHNFKDAIKRSLSVTAIWKISIDEITAKAKK